MATAGVTWHALPGSRCRAPGSVPRADVPGRRGWRGVPVELGFVAVALALNLVVRWYTRDAHDVALANATAVLDLEETLHVDWEHAWQDLALAVPGLEVFSSWYYVWGYFPPLVVTLVWLYVRHPDAYPRLRNAMLASGAVGVLLGYALFPTAPPRLTALGYSDTVAAGPLAGAARPVGLANEIAAIPSFHVAWVTLAAIAAAGVVRSPWVRTLLLLQPLVMSYVIVSTANHWVLDIPAGLVLVPLGLYVAHLLDRPRRGPLRAASVAAAASSGGAASRSRS